MNKYFITFLFTGINIVSSFSQGLEHIVVDKIPVPENVISQDTALKANSYTYRVFVDMAPDYKLIQVTGGLLNPIFIRTTTFFYNYSFGWTEPSVFIPPPPTTNPQFYDSWIAAGTYSGGSYAKYLVPLEFDTEDGAQDGLTGSPSSTVTPTLESSTDWTLFFGYQRGPSADGRVSGWDTTLATWYYTTGVAGYDDKNIVCIGQFTTEGEFSFEFSVSLKKPGGGNEDFVLRDAPLDNQFYHNDLVYPNEPPAVNLTNPVENQSLEFDETVALEAEASDPDGFIASVKFALLTFDDKIIQISEKTSPPFIYMYKVRTKNVAKLMAIATDNSFAKDTSFVSVMVNSAPIVTLESPTDGSQYSTGETVDFKATASDEDGTIARVEFYVDNSKVGEDFSEPYEYSWVSEPGQAAVKAKAIDDLGAAGESEIASISVVTEGNTNPSVSLTAPDEGAWYNLGDTVSIEATASDPDPGDGISKVRFIVNGSVVGEDASAPYKYKWVSIGSGTAGVSAVAYDQNGGSSASDTVYINRNLPPNVSLTNPVQAAIIRIGEDITITADATDSEGAIARVEFLFNGVVMYEDTESPYEYTYWGAELDTFQVAARAYDNRDFSRITDPVNLMVIVGVGIDNVVGSDEFFKIYPNPVDDRLIIEAAELPAGDLYYRLVNSLGQQVMFNRWRGEKQIILDVSDFDVGLYILNLWSIDKSADIKHRQVIIIR